MPDCACHDPTCRECPCPTCSPERHNALARHRGTYCPRCGSALRRVLDGKGWCPACGQYT